MTGALLAVKKAWAADRRAATPPAFRASARGTTPSGGTATTFSVTIPASVAAGDYVLFVVGSTGTTLTAVPAGLVAIPDGGGWSHGAPSTYSGTWPPALAPVADTTSSLYLLTLADGGGNPRLANSTDHGTTFTFTISASSDGIALCAAWSNCSGVAVGPVEGEEIVNPSTTIPNDGGGSPRLPPIYPGDRDLIVCFGVTQSFPTSSALPISGTPAGVTVRENVQVNPNPVNFANNLGAWIAEAPSSRLKYFGQKPDNTSGGFTYGDVEWSACGILALSPAGRRPTNQLPAALRGVPLHIYSDSLYSWVNPSSNPPYQFYSVASICDRLAWEMRASDYKNYSLPGAFTSEICGFAYGSVSYNTRAISTITGWTLARAGTWLSEAHKSGLVVCGLFGNDLIHDGDSGNQTKARAGALNAADALIRLLRASAMTGPTDASIVYTGTWTTTSSVNDVGNGAYRFTTTPGDKVTITTSLQNLDLVLLAIDDANFGAAGAAFTVKVDGSVYTTGTTSNQMKKTSGAGGPTAYNQSPYCAFCVPVGGLSAGSHTIEISHTGVGGAKLCFNSYLTRAATPPRIVLGKLPYWNWAQINALIGTSLTNAIADVYRAMNDTLVSRFSDGRVICFDPMESGEWDFTTMINTQDYVHPLDTGTGFYLRTLIRALQEKFA
jgi:hypothetical protein